MLLQRYDNVTSALAVGLDTGTKHLMLLALFYLFILFYFEVKRIPLYV